MNTLVDLYRFDEHVRDATYQFQRLETRLNQVDQRLERIESLVLDIKSLIKFPTSS